MSAPRKESLTRNWSNIVAVVALLAFPAVSSFYNTILLTQFLILGLLALSLGLTWGYAGIISFGQTAFFGVGGYTYAVTALNLLDSQGNTNIAIILAILVPAALSMILGYFMFYGRVSGLYVAIITLVSSLILQSVLINTGGAHQILSSAAGQQYVIGKVALGGFNGINDIPSFILGIPGFAVKLDNYSFYYFVVLVLLLIYFFARRIGQSPFGHVLLAIRENEVRAESYGFDIRLYKWSIFGIAGTIAGLSGAMSAASNHFINPDTFGLVPSALVVVWVLIGGRETPAGPLVGAVLLSYAQNVFGSVFPTQTILAIGILLLAVVFVFPKGIVPTLHRLATAYRGRK